MVLGIMAQLLSVPWGEGLDVENGGPPSCLEACVVWRTSSGVSRIEGWERSFKFVLTVEYVL